MATKLYRVLFTTKMGGWDNWAVDIEAKTAKEAKAEAERMWYERHKAHMFRIETRVLKDTEEFMFHYFVRVYYMVTDNGIVEHYMLNGKELQIVQKRA